MVGSLSLGISGLIGEKEKYDSKIDNLTSFYDSKITLLESQVQSLNNTLSEIDNRTTTNIPLYIHDFHFAGNPLPKMINQCIMTQGQNSKICKTESSISIAEIQHPNLIETTSHEYTFAGEKTWCRMIIDEKEEYFVIDNNQTSLYEKCLIVWNLMK